MACATSASVTATTPDRVWLLIGQVSSPGIGVSKASQIERAPSSMVSRRPDASERRVSSKPAGSAPQTSVAGDSAFTAVEIPAISPPPPTGLSTLSSSTPSARACSTISSPAVPWPAIMCGSS